MKTPLYEEHVALGARMVDFSGWTMPLLYLPAGRQGSGIIQEHVHTRECASMFDTCHMGVFEISGTAAESDLEYLITQSVSSLKPGACSYGYLLAENGGVIDDLICFCRSSNCFWLVVNAGTKINDAEWIQNHLSEQTSFVDCSRSIAKLDIQGPRSKEQMEKALDVSLPELKYFHFTNMMIHEVSCTVSRTGYTGEFGYELFLPAEHVKQFWKTLVDKSNIQPAGLGARDSLRLEMGYPLYGHELSREHTPAGASRGHFIDMSKNFIGKDAVGFELKTGQAKVLTGLQLKGRMAARCHDIVLNGRTCVGQVTSGLFAPSLKKAIALAYVDRDMAKPGQELEIEVRAKKLPATVVEIPFYKNGTAKA